MRRFHTEGRNQLRKEEATSLHIQRTASFHDNRKGSKEEGGQDPVKALLVNPS